MSQQMACALHAGKQFRAADDQIVAALAEALPQRFILHLVDHEGDLRVRLGKLPQNGI